MMKRWTFGKHALLSVLVALVLRLVMQRTATEVSSYGVIGSLDGPTTIFIARKGSTLRSFVRKWLWILVLPLLLLLYWPIRLLACGADE